MSVFPGDVVSTSVGVLHVESVVMERSREDVSFAMSGVDGMGVVHSNIPVGEGMVPLAVDVSDTEALVWFDRERRLRRLGDAVFSPGDGFEVLGRLMPGRVGLSLSDCESVDTVLGHLKEAEANLVEAGAWVVGKRAEAGKQVGVIRFQNLSVASQHLFTSLAWHGGYATDWKLTLGDPADMEADFTLYEVKKGIDLPEGWGK